MKSTTLIADSNSHELLHNACSRNPEQLEQTVRSAIKQEIDAKFIDPELLLILDSLPDIELDIVRVQDSNDGEQNRSQLCDEMNIDSNATSPFFPDEAIKMFLECDMLKNCILYDSRTILKLYILLRDEKVSKTLEILFWMVYLIKFEPDRLTTINELRRNIGFLYSKMFEHIPQPKEDILTLLQFVYGYLVHAYHYKLFPNERKQFNIRFVLDCYHIVIYVMTGVLITDYFIHNYIEKLFQDNFFQYQHDSGPMKLDYNMQENSVFQSKMGINKDDFNQLRCNELTHDDIADA
jgi:hypothetical protein